MKTAQTLLLSALLFFATAFVAIDFSAQRAGYAFAALGDRGAGGRVRGGRGGGAAPRAKSGAGNRASKIDRQPRASSARDGSTRSRGGAPAKTPKPTAVSRPSTAKAGSKGAKRPEGLSTVSDAKPSKARPAAAKDRDGRKVNRNELTNKIEKPASKSTAKRDMRDRKVSPQQRDAQKRDLQRGRKDYETKRADIRKDRGDTLVELQENRLDFKEERREDRMDFAEDRRRDRMDFREDMYRERRRLYGDLYHHHHYWGYDDDDDDNWFWLLFGGLAGYAIGASINDEPEGSVPVTTGNTTYQYYGGTFYQPASDGQGYTTVPAPVNAQVEAPPIDCTIVFTPPPDDLGYCYFQGAFFLYDDNSDNYVVTMPQAGTEIPYLPEGYEITTVDGVDYYQLGAVNYRLYMEGEEEVFVVAKLP